MDDKELALGVFKAGIEAVKPDRLIRNWVGIHEPWLEIGGNKFDLRELRRIIVVGAGKASGLMAQAIEGVLGSRIAGGAVVVKYGHGCACEHVEILEAGHPYPDQAGIDATQKIVRLCKDAGEGDLVLCLLSGGGSALLADYPPGSTLEEWIAFSKCLVNSGATINEINAVRKHLSQVKGGQLARLAYPAQVVSLLLSDVVGDPLDVIASGPTVADTSTFLEVREALRKNGLEQAIPKGLLESLATGYRGEIPETPKPGDPFLARTTNLVVGNNRLALEAGLKFARKHGVEGVIVTDRLEGETHQAAEAVVEKAIQMADSLDHSGRMCLLFGGETTLKVTGDGLGGRNQHFALAAARLISGKAGITLLAGGTDGTDGPTEMAGAVVDGNTWVEASASGLHSQQCLVNFDSYRFFQRGRGHVFTGPTMTNVMDMVVVIVR